MKTTQTDRVLDYLKRHGTITDTEARGELGVARLASRIDELRKGGWDIQTEMVQGQNRWGDKVRYGEYTLICDEQWRLAI